MGGTKIQAAQVDTSGRMHKCLKKSTPVEGGHVAVQEKIIEMVKELLDDEKGRPEGFGIGVAGQIDKETREIIFAPNLKWNYVNIIRGLEKELNLKGEIINDVRAATLGEWLYAAGKGCDDLICMYVGTGVGGGIISGGQVLSGYANSAGEIGHITIDVHGPICKCGNKGCLEAIAGGWAIAKRAKEAVEKDPEKGKILKDIADEKGKDITAEVVSEAYSKGSILAKQLVDETVEALIAGSVTVVNALSPQRLIFGGGVIEGIPEMVERIEKGVKNYALKAATQDLDVTTAKLGNEAGVIGAASLVLNKNFQDVPVTEKQL